MTNLGAFILIFYEVTQKRNTEPLIKRYEQLFSG